MRMEPGSFSYSLNLEMFPKPIFPVNYELGYRLAYFELGIL
jgi:hypothetical protein